MIIYEDCKFSDKYTDNIKFKEKEEAEEYLLDCGYTYDSSEYEYHKNENGIDDYVKIVMVFE